MRALILTLVSFLWLAVVGAPAIGEGITPPEDASTDHGWLLVGEDLEGNVIIERLTQMEPKHTGGREDLTCDGFAPILTHCVLPPKQATTGATHGFAIHADCLEGIVHEQCYVGTLESHLTDQFGNERVFRWSKGVISRIGLISSEPTSDGPGVALPSLVTQTCHSFQYAHHPLMPGPDVEGGVGQWRCFLNVD